MLSRKSLARHVVSITRVISAAVIGACASVHTTSLRGANAPKTAYPRIAVLAVTPRVDLEVRAESAFVEAGANSGTLWIPAHTLVLPGRSDFVSAIGNALRSRHIDALLVLTDQTTAAPTVEGRSATTPLCLKREGDKCTETMNVTTGEASSRQDQFTIHEELVPVETGVPVWVGTTNLNRNGVADSHLFTALAGDVIKTLVHEGLARPVSDSASTSTAPDTAPQRKL